MSTLNIGGDKADASYRYKMPALVTKIEGRGNGIKTVILNMHDLAKSLHIHPAYPTKFFGIELGAQSKFSSSTDRAVVNGAHQPGDLAKILERFIAQFILCPVCKLPELKMSVKSSIKIDCAACGHNSTIKTGHKLAQYIIKNPPAALAEEEKRGAKKKVKVGEEDEVEEKVEKKKGGRREHKGKDKKKKKGGEGEGAEGEGEEGGADEEGGTGENGLEEAGGEGGEEEEEVEVVKEKPKKKEREREKEGGEVGGKVKAVKSPSAAASPSAASAKQSDDVWFTDTSKEAQQARKEAEFKGQRDAASASIEAILASSKVDNKQEAPVTTLKIFLAQGQRSTEEIQAELKRITLAKGLDQPAKVKLFLDAVTDIDCPKDPKATAALFHKHRAVLSTFTVDRATSVQFLCGVEELLGSSHKELMSSVPHVLKTLYDDDVCDEDSIVSWWDSPPESSWLVKKEVAVSVRAKAKVFVDWLKTAEDEGEDGEEEEEGEEDDGEDQEDGEEEEEEEDK